jgi:protease I
MVVRFLAFEQEASIQVRRLLVASKGKIAALVADAFQEEEYFFPKVALNEAGYQVEVVSSRKEPVEIYSYFSRTGLLDVERAITQARPEDYVGVLIPGGAKSPALLAEDPRVTKFVQDVSALGGVIACICRGSMLAARSKVVSGRRMTGFNDSASYPELVVQPDAEAAGATWVQDAPVVVDRNLVTSPHPRHSVAFSAAIVDLLGGKRRGG